MSVFPMFVPYIPALFYDAPSFNSYIASPPIPVKAVSRM